MNTYGDKRGPTKKQRQLLAELEAHRESPFGVTLDSLETLDISSADAYKHIKKLEREDATYAGKHKRVGKKEREKSRIKSIIAISNAAGNAAVGLGISTRNHELGPEYIRAYMHFRYGENKKSEDKQPKKSFYPK